MISNRRNTVLNLDAIAVIYRGGGQVLIRMPACPFRLTGCNDCDRPVGQSARFQRISRSADNSCRLGANEGGTSMKEDTEDMPMIYLVYAVLGIAALGVGVAVTLIVVFRMP